MKLLMKLEGGVHDRMHCSAQPSGLVALVFLGPVSLLAPFRDKACLPRLRRCDGLSFFSVLPIRAALFC
ncbi:hypothetical protein [Alloyangia pacifica]|uniref:Uncharacterized protein n=1 Tax=Alloyangia pacifica TaxID=311180 RepID=A0A1I6SYX7_9RHOB|nr:hypothetical protein SAMN04488245_105148 [Alloyangia pacifica]SFS82040.1 hypothetical protein SAMN04488050_105148 [Alloyangia pacifica]